MKTLDDDYWHLQCAVQYVKKRGPVFESVPCDDASHSSFAMFYDDEALCHKCHGSGWMKKELPYPKKPSIPEDLLTYLSKCYKQWCSENAIPDINLNI